MVIITEEFIESGKSERGGWTKNQLAILGVSWPPATGWKRMVIGRAITETAAKEFTEARKAWQN